MQKINYFNLIIFIILTGCSVSHRGQSLSISPDQSFDNTIAGSTAKNLTNNNFFINKGKIQTKGEAGKVSLYFTMKYKLPGIYLISLRSKTGMEAFRIYLSGDTVLINDRLNKTLMYGNTNDFEQLTGLSMELLKISIGDLYKNDPKADDNEKCENNAIRIGDYHLGVVIKTTLDCSISKARSVLLTTANPDEYININYKNYKNDIYSVPKTIEINDFAKKIKIKILIYNYSVPWYGDIDFIPGSGYKIRPLQ